MRIANVLAGFSLARGRRAAQGGRERRTRSIIQQDWGALWSTGRRPGARAAGDRGHRGPDRDLRPLRINKSHAVAYSVLSYQTRVAQGALRARVSCRPCCRPNRATPDNVVRYITKARELGLEVLAPDVKRVGSMFTGGRRPPASLRPRRDQERRPGAIESILAGRTAGGPYRSLVDLCDGSTCASATSGPRSPDRRRACDSLGAPRPAGGDARREIGEAQRGQVERNAGQVALFGDHRRRTPHPPPHPGGRAVVEHDRRHAKTGRTGLLHLRPPPRAIPRGGGAFRDPHDRDPGPVERPASAGRRGGTVVEAANLQEDGRRYARLTPRGLFTAPRRRWCFQKPGPS